MVYFTQTKKRILKGRRKVQGLSYTYSYTSGDQEVPGQPGTTNKDPMGFLKVHYKSKAESLQRLSSAFRYHQQALKDFIKAGTARC